jgi:Phage integrase, N-terminal SAM-like domain
MNSILTPPPKLLEQVRLAVRYRHFSLSTERAYLYWICAFVKFHGANTHPQEMPDALRVGLHRQLAASKALWVLDREAQREGECVMWLKVKGVARELTVSRAFQPRFRQM